MDFSLDSMLSPGKGLMGLAVGALHRVVHPATGAASAKACRRIDRIGLEVPALTTRWWRGKGCCCNPIKVRAVGGEAPVVDHGSGGEAIEQVEQLPVDQRDMADVLTHGIDQRGAHVGDSA